MTSPTQAAAEVKRELCADLWNAAELKGWNVFGTVAPKGALGYFMVKAASDYRVEYFEVKVTRKSAP